MQHMMVSLLVAVAENGVIGKNNTLPWHLPNDLRYFKNLTWGMPVVMGRKTFESIGRPLPGRTNIVITRNPHYAAAGLPVVHTIGEAITAAQETGAREIFVIGGAEIYRSVLDDAHRVYLTRIHQPFEGDVYFPQLDPERWQLVKQHRCAPDEKNLYAHTFEVWERSKA